MKDARDLFVVETAEVTHLNYLAATRSHFRKRFQRLIKSNQFTALIRSYRCCFFERDLLRAAAALGVRVAPRVIDQDPPHDLRGDGEEVRTIGPLHVFLIDETNVSFVDERGGLERVAFSFPAHVAAREPVQFVVDQGIQLVERGLVPVPPFGEQFSDLMLPGWLSHFCYVRL